MAWGKRLAGLLALSLVVTTGGQVGAAVNLKSVKKVEVQRFTLPTNSAASVVLTPSTNISDVSRPIQLAISSQLASGGNPSSVHYRVSGRFCYLDGDSLFAMSPTTCTVIASISTGTFSAVVSSPAMALSFGTPQDTLTVLIDTGTPLALAKGTAINLRSVGGTGNGEVQYQVSPGDLCQGNGAGDGANTGPACSGLENKVGSVCSIVGSVLTATASSTCEVTAIKAADSTYFPQTSKPISIKFGPGNGSQPIILPPGPTTKPPIVTPPTTDKIPQPIELVISNPPSDTDRVVGETVTITTKGGSGTGRIYLQWVLGTNCSIRGDVLVAFAQTTCLLNAIKVGDTTYKSQTSQNVSFTFHSSTVLPALTIDPTTPTTAMINTPVVIKLSGGNTSAVKWLEVSSAQRPGACSLNGYVLTSSTADDCTVIAHQNGIGNYFSSQTSPYTISFR